MGRQLFLGAAMVAAATTHASVQQVPRVSTNELKDFRGRTVTVCGKVVTYDCDLDNDRTLTLDLDAPYWTKKAGIVIAGAARSRFAPAPEHRFTLGNICATGTVERREGRDVLLVDDPANISIEQEPPTRPFPVDAARPCDAGVTMPQVIREAKPRYTLTAMRALQQGPVLLEAMVRADGSVGAARVLWGFRPDHGLDDAALDAVKRWRFRPAAIAGQPTPIVVTIEMTFTLK